MLRRIRIDSVTYNELVTKYHKYIEECDDLNPYYLKGYKDKNIIKATENEMIIQGYRLNERYTNDIIPYWMQVVCVCDDSLEYKSTNKIIWSSQANKAVNRIIDKYYSNKEKDDLYAKHSISNKPQYLTTYLPTIFEENKIHKFTNCKYYDINKAHTDALCEIFPKCRDELTQLVKEDKLYINMFVGDLCNSGHRNTYNWICQRTYNKIMSYIEESKGLVIYAKTDGFIVWCPNKELETSNEIGQIKQLCKDGVVYAYRHCEDDFKYTIYQYDDIKEGITKKGTAKLKIRNNIDLSKGQIVKSKLVDKVEIIEEKENYEIF